MKLMVLALSVLSQYAFAANSLEEKCIATSKIYAAKVEQTWLSTPRFAGILYNNCRVDVNGTDSNGESCSFRYEVNMQQWEVAMVEISGSCVPY